MGFGSFDLRMRNGTTRNQNIAEAIIGALFGGAFHHLHVGFEMKEWEQYQSLGEHELGKCLQQDFLVRKRTIDYLKMMGSPVFGADLFQELSNFVNSLLGECKQRDIVAQVLLLCRQGLVQANGLANADYDELCNTEFCITPKGYFWDGSEIKEEPKSKKTWAENIFKIDKYRK